MTIPSELLNQQNIMVVALLAAVSTLFKLWTSARDDCVARDHDAAALLMEQKVLNERALAQIQFREFEREVAKKDAERCDRELQRCRYPPPVGGPT